jgi:osmoprotectant transport system permease protein
VSDLRRLADAQPVVPDFGTVSSCAERNGTFCWDWFSAHWSGTFQPALLQHIELTVMAVAIGFAISAVFAVLTYRARMLDSAVTLLNGILYAVPALALFQILVPLTGLGILTVEIALVAYTLLVLFRSMINGLRSVPPDVLESAQGMGLTERQIFLKIELPFAVPALVAGLRVAVVTTISLATIAAFVTDWGLGRPIFDAMQRGNFKTEFVAAASLAVALALVMDGLLVLLQRVLAPWIAADRQPRERTLVMARLRRLPFPALHTRG